MPRAMPRVTPKGNAKANDKATAKAKVKAKANDQDISTNGAKVHTPCSAMTKVAHNAARGWLGIGVTLEGMTNNGYQVVMHRLKPIRKEYGDGNDPEHYKSLRGQAKLEFALQLKVDRSSACMTAT